MNDKSRNTTNHDDRLLDRALSEVLGGDAPPDLSERILAAASQQPLVTSVSGDLAMNETKKMSRTGRMIWISGAIAASLLVVGGLLLPAVQPAREAARRNSANVLDDERDFGQQGIVTHAVPSPDQPPIVYPDQEIWSELINRRKMYANNDLERMEEPRTISRKRGLKNYYSNSIGTPELNDRTIYFRTDEAHFSPESHASRTPTASPQQNSAVEGLLADELRLIQQQIIAKKEELLDAEVMKTVAVQQANSTTALEAAIQEEMARDPMVQKFQQEQYAVTQQMTQLRATSTRKNSPEVKRLQEHLRTLDQQVQEYRIAKEAEMRSRFKSAPNDALARVMSEYMIRRRSAEGDLARLEQQYKERIEQLQGIERGRGPGNSGDQYTRIYENPFIEAQGENAVSTFSIDVDTASYANVRQFLMQSSQLPPPDAVRLEELVNYFDYGYSGPTSDVPFAAHVEVAGCPWQPEHRLVRIGIKGREIERTKRPQSNLVFLIDVSGSMNEPTKLPLLVAGMKMLTRELGENDRVAIVVYASSEGLALPSTPGDQQATILAALEQLRAGGSTAGGAGIKLAYHTAQDNFVEGGTNRVILCTDGDFNVGVTSTAELERTAEAKAKESGIFLTVLGFGRGNLNDAMMEAISGKGNGNYHYIDNQTEARKVLVEEMVGTLVTIAKDVKIQVEFNPARVAGYRLLGYENRMLRTEDFNDDKKDAGEIGAGHTVTVLYEIVPTGKAVGTPSVDPLKYQQSAKMFIDGPMIAELLTLKIRYKQPDGDKSTKLEFPIDDKGGSFSEATEDFQFAAAVTSFGMLLRDSEHRGNTSYAAILEIAENGANRDPHGYRAEFLQLVQRAKQLAGE